MRIFSQISTLRSLPAEFWAAAAALITGLVLIAKKLLPRPKPKPEHITRAQFHAGLDKIHDRITAGYLALGDKIELQHNRVLTRLDDQAANFERRLDTLDSAVARVDERTRSPINPIIQ
jgi:hypothetical protein